MKIKNTVQLFVGILISGIALWFIFKDIALKDLIDSFKAFKSIWLIPSFVCFALNIWLRGIRWCMLFKPHHDIGIKDSTKAIMICFALNSIFPARAGEFARSYLIGKQYKTGFSNAIGTVILERVLDGLTLLIFFAIILTIVPISPVSKLSINVFSNKTITLTGAMLLKLKTSLLKMCIFLLLGIIALSISRIRSMIIKIIKSFTLIPNSISCKIEDLINNFAKGLTSFHSPKRIINLSIMSILVWITTALSFMYISYGFPFNTQMSFLQSIAITGIVCIFILIPAAPGFWGFFEAGVIFGVVILGIHQNDVVVRSYAILVHITQWLPLILIGLPLTWMSHISLNEIEK